MLLFLHVVCFFKKKKMFLLHEKKKPIRLFLTQRNTPQSNGFFYLFYSFSLTVFYLLALSTEMYCFRVITQHRKQNTVWCEIFAILSTRIDNNNYNEEKNEKRILALEGSLLSSLISYILCGCWRRLIQCGTFNFAQLRYVWFLFRLLHIHLFSIADSSLQFFLSPLSFCSVVPVFVWSFQFTTTFNLTLRN